MIYTVLNKQDFEQELDNAGDKLVVIDFYANWCGPCKIIEPKFRELSAQYADRAKFLKVNVDDCEDIAVAYNITSMPTLVFKKNNELIDTIVGGNAEELAKKIEKYVEEPETLMKSEVTDQNAEADLENHEYSMEHDLHKDDLQEDPTAVLDGILDDQL